MIITSTIGLILISKKETLVAQKIATQMVKKYGISIESLKKDDYGVVLAQEDSFMPGVTIEQVALNVPDHLNSENRIIRFGRLVRHPQAKGTILICHGFMCDKFDVGFLRQMFPQGSYNFMTFDFRAHGESACGQQCTFGRDEACDVITAAKFLKSHPDLQNKPLIVYGFSMGAVSSIEAQAIDSSLFDAMILDCPFDSCENVIKRNLSNLQFTFLGYDFTMPACELLQKYAFHPYVQSLIKNILKTVSNLDTKNIDVRMYPTNPAESIQKITVPCFFIHCKNDEKVAASAVKNVYEGAGTDYKVLWLTNGRRHFDSYFYNPEKYVEMLRTFLDKVVDGSLKNMKFNKIVEDPDESLSLHIVYNQ